MANCASDFISFKLWLSGDTDPGGRSASWFPRAELSQMKAERENDDRVVAACDVSFHRPSTHDSQQWYLVHERHTIRAWVRSQSVPPSTHAGSLADRQWTGIETLAPH
ncbi:hypothetical protein V8C43DRAFT_304785 [Trichoderma afarasin]